MFSDGDRVQDGAGEGMPTNRRSVHLEKKLAAEIKEDGLFEGFKL